MGSTGYPILYRLRILIKLYILAVVTLWRGFLVFPDNWNSLLIQLELIAQRKETQYWCLGASITCQLRQVLDALLPLNLRDD